MPVAVLPLFHTSPCRRQFPLLLHLLFIWLLATKPSQAISRPQAPSRYPQESSVAGSAQVWLRRQSHQPYQTLPAHGYFYGVGPAETTQTFQASTPLQTADRDQTHQQRVTRTEGTGAETAGPADEDDSRPLLMKVWATRNSLSKTNAQTYLESPYGAIVQNNRKKVVQTANLSIGSPDIGQIGPLPGQEQQQIDADNWRSPFEPMPPFRPPPTGYVLPDLFSTEASGRSFGADRPPLLPPVKSSGFSPVKSQPNLKLFASDAEAVPFEAPKQQRRKRVLETVDKSLGGYDRSQPKSVRAEQYYNSKRRSFLGSPSRPPAWLPNLKKSPKSRLLITTSDGKLRHNPPRANDLPVHQSTAHGGAIRKKKRVTERDDLSLSSNDRKLRSNKQRQRQIFKTMPPFRPPPTGMNLPDLFSTKIYNGSGMIIGQRPTRPSSAYAKSGSDFSHLGRNPDTEEPGNSDHPGSLGHPSNPAVAMHRHQFGVREGKEQHTERGPPRGDQGDPDLHEFDGRQGYPPAGPDPRGPQDTPNERLIQTTDGSTRTHSFADPAVPSGVMPSRLTPQVPPIDYGELPAPRPERLDPHSKHLNPRDVLVEIETRRLHMTYSVNAPPYFTFESLLSRLATYLMPGFCVDLAVTRRDENCEIISHMASLKTGRQQDWLIEIRDTGGKIIWLNQCMPDAMLFIVPGFRVRFKFVSHVQLVPGGASGEAPSVVPSTPGSEPEPGPIPLVGLPIETDQQPMIGSLAQSGLPSGPPLAPQQQEFPNS